MTVNVMAMNAFGVAAEAARRSGVVVRTLHELADLQRVVVLFDDIWRPDTGSPLVNIEQLRAMTHAGNYLAGAFDGDGRLIGACVGFFAAPSGTGLHSHIAGVAADARRRHVGFALKLHQRAWALERDLTEITWTFDPLLSRNAYFNLCKLGARPREYLVDFYGDINDSINAGQGSDRLLVAWTLGAAPGRPADVGGPRMDVEELRASGAVPALTESAAGWPECPPVSHWKDADVVLVQVPAEIETLRQSDHGAARQWRLAVRDVLGTMLRDGGRVAGFSRSGFYVVERTAE
ncbi:GNAT family N-acetyltransferase [Phytoactinopolyspora alkaliphila]|uniref:GNAT family N-acetyltransferase n=2 Tax=Phytoactinopolyspora alkaliphila TaxID=1783498 RepID=A0A6N9YN56_9ACTN|nr:GNAT family N-acetyltransferase [Phytoactinopolyspora alkaliphila]